MATEKKKGLSSGYFYGHILLVGLLTYVLLGQWTNWLGAFVIMVVHGIIDLLKASLSTNVKWADKNDKWLFAADQLLHLITLAVYWLIATGSGDGVLFQEWVRLGLFTNTDVLIVIMAYLIVTTPVGILIGFLTQKWKLEIEQDDKQKQAKNPSVVAVQEESLKDAGKTIGMIERALVLTFILIQQYEAIGFLIAAKSVFRFGDLKEAGQRKRTEYILIGNLQSFMLAIAIGLITRFFILKF